MAAHESIQYNTDVPADGKDPLERIAKQWRDIEGFTAAYDPKKLRGIMVGELQKSVKLTVLFSHCLNSPTSKNMICRSASETFVKRDSLLLNSMW